jgi:hypothetical protein
VCVSYLLVEARDFFAQHLIRRRKHPSVDASIYHYILYIETHLEPQLIGFIMPYSIHFLFFTNGSSFVLSRRMPIISIVAFFLSQRPRQKAATAVKPDIIAVARSKGILECALATCRVRFFWADPLLRRRAFRRYAAIDRGALPTVFVFSRQVAYAFRKSNPQILRR